MNTLLKFPTNYSFDDYREDIKDRDGVDFNESDLSDDGFYDWCDLRSEGDFEWFAECLHDELKKTKIKKGFLSIENGGWQAKKGITIPFDISASSVISKLSGSDNVTIEVFKEGRKLKFTRFSHDEPTGARITLHSMADYKKMQNSVFN
jgi:hypothetical protein